MNETKINKYIIYTRVSKDEQDNRTQEEYCLEQIKKIENGKPFEYEMFSDHDHSGTKSYIKRPKFIEALNALNPGDIFTIIRLDRMGRIARDLHNLYYLIIHEKEAKFLSITQPELSDPLIFSIYAGLAQKEVEHIKSRIKEKLQAKKNRKERTGNLPYGYKLCPLDKIFVGKGENAILKNYRVIPCEKEQEVVNTMLKLRASGFSYREIQDFLQREKIYNRAGNPFQLCSIYQILQKAEENRLAYCQ